YIILWNTVYVFFFEKRLLCKNQEGITCCIPSDVSAFGLFKDVKVLAYGDTKRLGNLAFH
ncbi:hypothetical protein ACJX0J_030708, partial [Zea mays]